MKAWTVVTALLNYNYLCLAFSSMPVGLLVGNTVELSLSFNSLLATHPPAEVDSHQFSEDHPLIVAAAEGDSALADMLLRRGSNVNEIDPSSGRSVLMLAAENGHENLVELFLAHNADTFYSSPDGQTAASVAKRAGYFRIADHLETVNRNRQLYDAVMFGSVTAVITLMRAGADPNAQYDGWNCLLQAAYGGFSEIVRHLLADESDNGSKYFVNVDVTEPDGWTSLHFAAVLNSLEIVNLLLKAGADPSLVNTDGRNPLQVAELAGSAEAASVLLQAMHEQGSKKEKTLKMIQLSKTGDILGLRELLSSSPMDQIATESHSSTNKSPLSKQAKALLLAKRKELDPLVHVHYNKDSVFVNYHNQHTYSALTEAIIANCEACVQFLVSLGSDVNLVEHDGWTAIHFAAHEGHYGIVEILLEAGADTRHTSPTGIFAHEVAFHSGFQQLSRRLISYTMELGMNGWDGHQYAPVIMNMIQMGDNVNERTQLGWTPLLFMSAWGETERALECLQLGAKPDATESNGWTALHFAAFRGDTTLAVHLLNENIYDKTSLRYRLTRLTRHGHNASVIAQQTGNHELASSLEELFQSIREIS